MRRKDSYHWNVASPMAGAGRRPGAGPRPRHGSLPPLGTVEIEGICIRSTAITGHQASRLEDKDIKPAYALIGSSLV